MYIPAKQMYNPAERIAPNAMYEMDPRFQPSSYAQPSFTVGSFQPSPQRPVQPRAWQGGMAAAGPARVARVAGPIRTQVSGPMRGTSVPMAGPIRGRSAPMAGPRRGTSAPMAGPMRQVAPMRVAGTSAPMAGPRRVGTSALMAGPMRVAGLSAPMAGPMRVAGAAMAMHSRARGAMGSAARGGGVRAGARSQMPTRGRGPVVRSRPRVVKQEKAEKNPTKNSLDDELDAYMGQSKKGIQKAPSPSHTGSPLSALDDDLDAYNKERAANN